MERRPCRCVLLLLDGLADRAYPELGGRTPLQAAETPHLDLLASQGLCGLMHAARPGIALPSEMAHWVLFGYGGDEFPGRGPLEALGAGIDLFEGEVAILARLVAVEKKEGCLMIVEDSPRLTEKEKEELLATVPHKIFPELEIRFQPTRGLRGVLILRGKASAEVSDSDPLEEGAPVLEIQSTRPGDPLAESTAYGLRQYLLEVWEKLEGCEVNRIRRRKGLRAINFLVTQRAGKRRRVESFRQRWGLSAATISSGLVYWGLGAYLGFEVIQDEDQPDPGGTLAHRLAQAQTLATRFDFLHIHHKAPDEAAHKKDPLLKKEVIEALDRALEPFMDWLTSPENLVVVTSDHATPSGGPLIHSGEPVPIVFHGPGVWQDEVKRFDELSCATGALGRIEARDFMYLVLNFLDRAVLWGLRDGPVQRPYFPGERKPFTVDRDS